MHALSLLFAAVEEDSWDEPIVDEEPALDILGTCFFFNENLKIALKTRSELMRNQISVNIILPVR